MSDQAAQDLLMGRVQPRHYLGIFVLASATLSYQILITRFFSVVLYYHFAFAAISLAMFGLTRGAMQVYSNPARYAPELVDVEFARRLGSLCGCGAFAQSLKWRPAIFAEFG